MGPVLAIGEGGGAADFHTAWPWVAPGVHGWEGERAINCTVEMQVGLLQWAV